MGSGFPYWRFLQKVTKETKGFWRRFLNPGFRIAEAFDHSAAYTLASLITRNSYQSQAACKLLRLSLLSNPFDPNPE